MKDMKTKKQNKRNIFIVTLGIFFLVLVYCFSGTFLIKVEVKENKSVDYSSLMLKHLNKNTDENILYSDLTFNQPMILFYKMSNGSLHGSFADYFEMDEDLLISNYDKIYDRYKFGYKKVGLSSAIWINNELDDFSESSSQLARKLHFSINKGNFNSSEVVEDINKWVKKKSHGKVNGVLNDNDLKDKHSVIVSTLYFNEKWNSKYELSDINDGKFNGTKGISNVKFMSSEEKIYLENDEAKGFMKPYKDDDIYFVGIIPKDNYELSDINILELLDKRSSATVSVKIPEFEYMYEHDFTENVNDLGFSDLLKPGSLDNIVNGLYVDKIIQKNYISVNSDGTEAASIDYVLNEQWSSLANNYFVTLDKPFVFLIYDDAVNQVLFIGQVNNI